VPKHQSQLPDKTRIHKSSQINLNDCRRHFSHKFRPRASTKTCTELCRTRHQFITGNRDGYFVSFVLVVTHTYIVRVVGAGITTPILSPRPEATTWHRVLDLVKLEKRIPGNHDSPHRWWPTNAPIISGAIGAKQ
jgi:hypothetical protein